MQLNPKALAFALAVLWAGAVFLVSVANLMWPAYGKAFLEMLASIYPGYHAAGTFADAISGSLYALVDGAICGFILGWLYNLVAGSRSRRSV
jgi:ABC-type phosphate transport system permease subunit